MGGPMGPRMMGGPMGPGGMMAGGPRPGMMGPQAMAGLGPNALMESKYIIIIFSFLIFPNVKFFKCF